MSKHRVAPAYNYPRLSELLPSKRTTARVIGVISFLGLSLFGAKQLHDATTPAESGVSMRTNEQLTQELTAAADRTVQKVADLTTGSMALGGAALVIVAPLVRRRSEDYYPRDNSIVSSMEEIFDDPDRADYIGAPALVATSEEITVSDEGLHIFLDEALAAAHA